MMGCTVVFVCQLFVFFLSFLLGFTKTDTNEADLNLQQSLGLICQKVCFEMEAQ